MLSMFINNRFHYIIKACIYVINVYVHDIISIGLVV